MLIINVYNTKGTPLINNLATSLQSHLRQHQYDSILMVGDFNLHHPLETAQFYTDGSGINEEIGAAMYCPTDRYSQQRYLGMSSEPIVYVGELEAILMVINYARDPTRMQSSIFLKSRIFTDSQAAMRSLAKPKRQSGQGIIEQILDQISEIYLTAPMYSMQFDWVPGHVGIRGNEMADQAAKSAAMEKINPSPQPTILKSALANEIHQTIEREHGSMARERRGICEISRNGT
jgi:ribonuclease HI